MSQLSWKMAASVLPHDLRRAMYRRLFPKTFDRLASRRHQMSDYGYCLDGYDRHECIFVHIPKCAGVSLTQALFGNRGGGHMSIWDYQMVYRRAEFNRYFKFAFVRNPWDRLVSAFHFLKKGGMNSHDAEWSRKLGIPEVKFDQFVRERLPRPEVHSFWHFMPQCDFVCDAWGRLRLDYVARFENINDEFQSICDRLGMSASLEKVNRTDGRDHDYRSYYTDTTRDLVADMYRRDIALFGYTFDKNVQPVSTAAVQCSCP